MNNNIFYLVKNGKEEYVYSVLDNPNFIKTNDAHVVKHIRSVFERLLQRAIPVGANGERHHEIFFQKLESRYGFYENKIFQILEMENVPSL